MQEITPNLPVTAEDNPPEVTREDLFIGYLYSGLSRKEAALEAGYSESYSTKAISNKFKSQRFITKLQEAYKGTSIANLPRIAKIHDMVIDDCLLSAANVPKHANTLKSIKQSAGVERVDHEYQSPMVNVQNIQNILLNVHTDSIPDAEVIS